MRWHWHHKSKNVLREKKNKKRKKNKGDEGEGLLGQTCRRLELIRNECRVLSASSTNLPSNRRIKFLSYQLVFPFSSRKIFCLQNRFAFFLVRLVSCPEFSNYVLFVTELRQFQIQGYSIQIKCFIFKMKLISQWLT